MPDDPDAEAFTYPNTDILIPSDPRICPHPSGARITTAAGFIQCAVCGKLEPADDLEQRQAKKDQELGRLVREVRPDLAEQPEKLLALIQPPPMQVETFVTTTIIAGTTEAPGEEREERPGRTWPTSPPTPDESGFILLPDPFDNPEARRRGWMGDTSPLGADQADVGPDEQQEGEPIQDDSKPSNSLFKTNI